PLMESGDSAALLVGDGPDGFALLRFRPSLWVEGLECYLAELYVVPHLRGERRGRALMDAVLAFAPERGAGYIHPNTGEDEVACWLRAGARRYGLWWAVVRLRTAGAMRELDVVRGEPTTTPENAATKALAVRLGFSRDGVLRQRNIGRGGRVDVVWCGLLRE